MYVCMYVNVNVYAWRGRRFGMMEKEKGLIDGVFRVQYLCFYWVVLITKPEDAVADCIYLSLWIQTLF